jgi:hypothetical protein
MRFLFLSALNVYKRPDTHFHQMHFDTRTTFHEYSHVASYRHFRRRASVLADF